MECMATTKRLDDAEIEERLRGRPIAIVKGSFKNTRESAQWLCLRDSSHGIFNAPPRQIIHANGNCPKCGKVAKLTDEIISEKLSTRPIRLVNGSLRGSDVKAIWECLSDSSHGSWEATPSSILNSKSGCPKCSGKLPLNEEEIKRRLNDRALALVNGSYNHRERTATWQCLTDSNHPNWDSSVKSVLYQRTGCPVCSGNTKLTESIVQSRLDLRPVELVEGSLKGSRKHATWKCLTDVSHPNWNATPDSVLGGSNCPACTGHEKINAEVIRRKIVDRDVLLLSEDVSSSKENAQWGCRINASHRAWSASVSSVLAGSGCPECAGNAKLSGQIINSRLVGRSIRLLEDTFKSSSQHARWICLAGKNHPEWDANVASVLSGVGCPSCAEYGFKEHKPAFIYIMRIGTEASPIGLKCGITNNDPSVRMGAINRKTTASINLIHHWAHTDGKLIRQIERKLLSTFEHKDFGDLLRDGGTETFHFTDLERIVNLVESELQLNSDDLLSQI
jgi:hypothetical protein